MKNDKTHLGLILALLILLPLLGGACYFLLSNGDGKLQEQVVELAKKISANDLKSVSAVYPDAAKADSLTLKWNEDSLDIVETKTKDTYLVKFGNNVDMTIVKGKDDNFKVKESHNLFAYDPQYLAFAKKTGQWKAGLTDSQLADRMKDRGLPQYLLDKFNRDLKNGLRIVSSGTYGDDYYEGEWVSAKGATFNVKNSTKYIVPGSTYYIIYKEGYWGGGSMGQEVVPGVDIASGATVTLKTKELGSSMESDVSQSLVVKGLSMEEFMALFVPTGNEYEEYIKENGNVNAADVPLSFSYEGVMGGCGTRLLMDGKEGSLMYNSHGPTFDGFDQQRGVDLVSYDPSSGKLVLKVSDMYDKVTGKLVGTLKNNQYTGNFVNVNGKSSPFTFK
ncbi:MAG: hypothetical protein IKX33_06080 [Prevotella sp.]|nr:hypothetical protein [Prevotella sp.]